MSFFLGVQNTGGRNTVINIGGINLTIKQGDITEEVVDAIINSSNSNLDLNQGNIISVKVKIKLLFIPDFFTLFIATELYKQRLSARSEKKKNWWMYWWTCGRC